MQSYLIGRSQSVIGRNEVCINIKSNYEELKGSSIVGPLFYILHTNDLPTIIGHFVVMHADNTSLLENGDDAEIGQHFENSFVNLKKWFMDNNVLMNTNKS